MKTDCLLPLATFFTTLLAPSDGFGIQQRLLRSNRNLVAFVRKNPSRNPPDVNIHPDTIDGLESFLNEAHSDMESVMSKDPNDELETTIGELRNDNADLDYVDLHYIPKSGHVDNIPDEDMLLHKGESRSKPVVDPTRLRDSFSEEEECEEPFVDFATEDELCWNEAPRHQERWDASKADQYQPPHHIDSNPPPTEMSEILEDDEMPLTLLADIDDDSNYLDLHKSPHGGHIGFIPDEHLGSFFFNKGGSRRQPVNVPTKLQQGDEECKEPFVDFATGDELCWGEG